MTDLVYSATLTIENRKGETFSSETLYFATRERAVAYAEHNTHASDNNGEFVGEWKNDWLLTSHFLGEDEMKNSTWDTIDTAVRTKVNVETVTLEEIEASL